MFNRMVSIRSPLIVRSSRHTSNLSTEGMGSALEQNEEFAKWWQEWVRRLGGLTCNCGNGRDQPVVCLKEAWMSDQGEAHRDAE